MRTHTFLFNNTCEDPSGPIFKSITSNTDNLKCRWLQMSSNERNTLLYEWTIQASCEMTLVSFILSGHVERGSNITEWVQLSLSEELPHSVLQKQQTSSFHPVDSCDHRFQFLSTSNTTTEEDSSATPLDCSVLLLSGWIFLVFYEAKSKRRLECVIIIFRRLDPDVHVPHRMNHTNCAESLTFPSVPVLDQRFCPISEEFMSKYLSCISCSVLIIMLSSLYVLRKGSH